MSNAVTSVILVHSSTLIVAWLWSLGKKLTVYASPILDMNGELCKPIHETLASRCYTLDSFEEKKDDMMAFGSGLLSKYSLYDICPGSNVPHQCTVTGEHN